MKKLSNYQSKIISLAGINSMALISGIPLTFAVTIPISIAILAKKESPHNKLVTEISRSFKMDYSDAEIYAKHLESICNKEYKRQLESYMTITK